MKNKSKENKDKYLSEKDIGMLQDDSKKYMAMFRKASTFNSGRMDAYAELMAFYQGNQHLLKQYKNKQPWVINMNTPYASVAIDNRVASLLSNDYIGELFPLAPEDTGAVDALGKLYKKEWERLGMDKLVRESIKRGAVVRESYIHLVFDKTKKIGGSDNKRLGALEGYHIEPGQIFIDPSARTLKEAHYMFVSGRVSEEETKQKYPKVFDLLNNHDSFTPEERGEVYVDNDYNTEQDSIYSKLVCYEKNENGKIDKTVLIGGVIAEETTSMEIRRFPIYQFRWKKAAQSCYGLSLMDEILSLQKAICSIESAITNTAISYAAPSMMVSKKSGIDPKVASRANGAPGVVYAVNGRLDDAMKPVIPPKIEDSILNIKTDFENKIDKITGNSNQFLGDIGTAGNTSSGTRIAVERAKIIEIDVLNNISEFVEDITNGIIDYLMYIYAGETVNVYEGKKPDGEHQFSEIAIPDEKNLKDLQYKYYIELDTKTPYSKERQKELLMEIFNLERQYDTPVKTVTVTDVIKNSDLENKDEIIERFNQLNNQDAETKAETITQLIATATEIGIPEELIQQGITEIISGTKETPALEEIMMMTEQAVQQEMSNVEEQLDSSTNMLMNAPGVDQEIDQMVQDSGMATGMEAGMVDNDGPATQELLNQAIEGDLAGLM